MFLDFQVREDQLRLMVLTGPKEKYDPKANPEVAEIYKKVQKLDKEIKKMRDKINPKLAEIRQSINEMNQKHIVEESHETEE